MGPWTINDPHFVILLAVVLPILALAGLWVLQEGFNLARWLLDRHE